MSAERPDLVGACRLRTALDLFTHTWDPAAFLALADGPLRRRDLRRRIGGDGGLRDKPLTEALARLTTRGPVTRHALPRPAR